MLVPANYAKYALGFGVIVAVFLLVVIILLAVYLSRVSSGSSCGPCGGEGEGGNPTPSTALVEVGGSAPRPMPPVYLTWYGIVSPEIVVGPDTFAANAATIVNYMASSPNIPYSGILLQLDPPTAAREAQGKPANFSCYVRTMANVIAGIPTRFRVGFHAVLEADATWEIGPTTILNAQPVAALGGAVAGSDGLDFGTIAAQNPGLARAGFSGTLWHGGAGANGDPAHFQSEFTGWYDGQSPATGACPYKVTGPFPPAGAPAPPPPPTAGPDALPPYWPSGCPGNIARVAWYCCVINALLRGMGSPQRVTMLNWDQEGNGPVGVACTLYQFVYALQQYGTLEDLYPGKPWLTFLNGGPDLDNTVAYGKQDGCTGWFNTPLNPQLVDALQKTYDGVKAPKTYGDVVTSKGAPEYYWFKGEDMGSVAALEKADPPYGMLPALRDMGLVGCFQSAKGKDKYDWKCGCRNTVYSVLANKPKQLLEVLKPLYDARRQAIPRSTPTFSIEHLGNSVSMLNYDTCINSLNFCKGMVNKGDNTNWACRNESKCSAASCGVANFFGVWKEVAFRNFLAGFNQTYKPESLMVYDAGFVPVSWLPSKVSDDLGRGLAALARTANYVPETCPASVDSSPEEPCDGTDDVHYCTTSCPPVVPRV